jgi:hypothetical protein
VWSEHPASNQADGPDYLQLLGPNQWMPDDVLPGQQELALDWFERLGALSDDVLSLFAVGLGLPPEQFAAAFDNDAASLPKLISYPPTPDGAAGVNAHTDTPLDHGRATNVGWFHGDQGADRTHAQIRSARYREYDACRDIQRPALELVPAELSRNHGTAPRQIVAKGAWPYTQLFVE